MPLILASASPQRAQILTRLGVDFVARPSHADELEHGEPEAVALENARRKGEAASAVLPPALRGEPVLAVDTLVALDGAIFGKPSDEAHARETLRTLAGRTHQVHSGLWLDGRSAKARTDVTFRTLDDAQIAWYAGLGEWRGRAGAYAIQERGALLVERVEGDYENVVGLPVAALVQLLLHPA